MSVINTNVSATLAANAILRNDRAMGTAMERLSTGLRINSAKDDAAGLAISTRMRSEVSGLEMAAKNANDAISMLEVAEGATLEISNMLNRMRELAVQSASGTYSDNDRGALDLEFGALMSEIDRIAKNTTWNTMSILNGDDVLTASAANTTVNIQLGAAASQTMTVDTEVLGAECNGRKFSDNRRQHCKWLEAQQLVSVTTRVHQAPLVTRCFTGETLLTQLRRRYQ